MNSKNKFKETIKVMSPFKIPIDLYAQFKAYCAKRDKTMTAVLIQKMRECAAGKIKEESDEIY